MNKKSTIDGGGFLRQLDLKLGVEPSARLKDREGDKQDRRGGLSSEEESGQCE